MSIITLLVSIKLVEINAMTDPTNLIRCPTSLIRNNIKCNIYNIHDFKNKATNN